MNRSYFYFFFLLSSIFLGCNVSEDEVSENTYPNCELNDSLAVQLIEKVSLIHQGLDSLDQVILEDDFEDWGALIGYYEEGKLVYLNIQATRLKNTTHEKAFYFENEVLFAIQEDLRKPELISELSSSNLFLGHNRYFFLDNGEFSCSYYKWDHPSRCERYNCQDLSSFESLMTNCESAKRVLETDGVEVDQ